MIHVARPPAVSSEELTKMIRDQRMTYAEVAAKTGLSVSGVKQAARRAGLVRKRLSHKWAVPWTISEEHNWSKPHSYLRRLSRIAQGDTNLDPMEAMTAINWARRLVDAGLDIDYDRKTPPNDESIEGGFFTKPADPSNWHVKKVLSRATARMTRDRKKL